MTSIADVVARQRRVLHEARPIDRRVHPDRWTASDFAGVSREQMLASFWGAEVPGSGAYDEMLTGAVVAAAQLGWDVTGACAALDAGWAAVDRRADVDALAGLGDVVFDALEAGRVAGPRWDLGVDDRQTFALLPDVEQRTLTGWQGQIAGGAFGTALEGCTGAALASVYGPITSYVGQPTALNDDVVYELVALAALADHGAGATTSDYAAHWSARIPFGWSAEWVVLDNLSRHVPVAHAATVRNPMAEWIGAQMRGMVFGQLCPGEPARAASLARVEAQVSHRNLGVEGGAFAAKLSALAYSFDDSREVVRRAELALAPSRYRQEISQLRTICESAATFDEASSRMAPIYDRYNWIHALPNIAGVIAALWFGENDFTTSFSMLARAGLDVDCNAGLVGTVLGICNAHVPSAWIDPIGDRIETYLPSLPFVKISALTDQTLAVAANLAS